jgi:hypothetical protein
MNARHKACAVLLGTTLVAGLVGCLVGCGASYDEEAAAPPPPPVDTAAFQRAPRPPAGTADLASADMPDGGDIDAASIAEAANRDYTRTRASDGGSRATKPSAH